MEPAPRIGPQKKPPRGVVNSGRFEETEWDEPIDYLPFRYKGMKIFEMYNDTQQKTRP